MATTYKYKATSDETYYSLAAYAVTLSVPVSLFPQHKTIAVTDEAINEIDSFIEKNCPDIIISSSQIEVDDINELLADPTSDTSILRDIAKSFQTDLKAYADFYNNNLEKSANLEKELEKTTRDKDAYYRYWKVAEKKCDRVYSQIEAISILMRSIFPNR